MAMIMSNRKWAYGLPQLRCHMTANGEPHVHEHHMGRPHPGHKVIAICGKGGVGKTAFAALMTHAFLHREDTGRLLVIDADPALGLALALGIEPQSTIASVRDELLAAATSGSAEAEREVAQKLDYLVFQSLVELDDYAFLAMGRSKDIGCYCSVNDLLRDSVELLAGEFDTILIDGEAGLEQINRQVVASIDALVAVTDGSARGARTIETIWDMAQENDLVKVDRIGMVLNRQYPDSAVAPLRDDVRPHLLGVIPADDDLARLDREERSLFELPHDNPAMHAVEHICEHLLEHMD